MGNKLLSFIFHLEEAGHSADGSAGARRTHKPIHPPPTLLPNFRPGGGKVRLRVDHVLKLVGELEQGPPTA
eukprot:4344002-Pyramimonas_sp.AAC.1